MTTPPRSHNPTWLAGAAKVRKTPDLLGSELLILVKDHARFGLTAVIASESGNGGKVRIAVIQRTRGLPIAL